jgi:cyanophycinase
MYSGPESRRIRMAVIALLYAGLFLVPLYSIAQQRLVMVGGGPRPKDAMSRFVEWAGKDRARILIIPWATEEPQASFEGLKKDFEPFKTALIELAPSGPLTEATRQEFLSQLDKASGVFFTGGDQVRIMNVLKDKTLLDALKRRYDAGVVFGGTSAGTAIMSERMITGEGDFTVIDGTKVETSRGLGLLPADVIVDQHFIKRQRQNRLFGLILTNPRTVGIGIDEGTALLLSDNRKGEVVGASKIMMVAALSDVSALTVKLIGPGKMFDLARYRPKAGPVKVSVRKAELSHSN